jgi:hypothetical protein
MLSLPLLKGRCDSPPLFFSRRDIHGYTTFSKYTMRFVGVFQYKGKPNISLFSLNSTPPKLPQISFPKFHFGILDEK